ncbi:MAG: leucine-rich repeat domain-containing protein [Oscillospiraceae bacterium]|nr:leucine-rich repeat domain-containing protein [Oscillospiraceae bacterium]
MFHHIFSLLGDLLNEAAKAAKAAESRPPSVRPMNSTARATPTQPQPPTDFSDLPQAPARTVQAVNVPGKNAILPEAYIDRTDLTEFTVPDGVRTIGYNAFRNCSALQRITLPDTLEEIGNGAFQDCRSLTEIHIPDSVKKIGNHAFSKCSQLKSFRFPKGMTGKRVEVGMFYDCTSLETVELPERLSGLFENVFPNCECLRNVTLPEGISEIGSWTFQDCGLIEEIKIPSTVSVIQYKAFLGSGLREIFIPDNVKIIDIYRTFASCKNLQRIRLPIGVQFRHVFHDRDEDGGVGTCFADCDALKTVYLGTRQFELEGKLNDDSLLMMYMELAADGDQTAAVIVRKDQERAMQLLDLLGNDDLRSRLKANGIA